MRRKSDRKAKSSPEKKTPEVATRRSHRRRRQKSESSSEPEAPAIAPIPEPVKVDEPVPTEQPKQPSNSNSDEEKPEQPVWQVKTSESPGGEIQKLKICLQRPSSTPERIDRSPRRSRKHKHGTSHSQTDEELNDSCEEKSIKVKDRRKNKKSRKSSSTGSGVEDSSQESLSAVDKSPSHGDRSPSHGDRSPSHGDRSPSHGDRSPSHGDRSPSRGERSPSRGDKSPSHGDKSPHSDKSVSPSRRDKSPEANESPHSENIKQSNVEKSQPDSNNSPIHENSDNKQPCGFESAQIIKEASVEDSNEQISSTTNQLSKEMNNHENIEIDGASVNRRKREIAKGGSEMTETTSEKSETKEVNEADGDIKKSKDAQIVDSPKINDLEEKSDSNKDVKKQDPISNKSDSEDIKEKSISDETVSTNEDSKNTNESVIHNEVDHDKKAKLDEPVLKVANFQKLDNEVDSEKKSDDDSSESDNSTHGDDDSDKINQSLPIEDNSVSESVEKNSPEVKMQDDDVGNTEDKTVQQNTEVISVPQKNSSDESKKKNVDSTENLASKDNDDEVQITSIEIKNTDPKENRFDNKKAAEKLNTVNNKVVPISTTTHPQVIEIHVAPLDPARKRCRWKNTILNLLKSTPKITSDDIREICPDIQMLPLDEIRLELETRVKNIKSSESDAPPRKKQRKSEDEKMHSPKEMLTMSPPEKNQMVDINPLLANRKISIVSDDASNLQQPLSPAKNEPASILYVKNLVRPFTLNQLKELLSRTGNITENGFWINKIKSECYVQYESEEQAVETRNALHGVHWPVANGRRLDVDFGTEEDMEKARNPPVEVAPVEVPKPEPMPEVKPKEEIIDWREERERERVRREQRGTREWDVGKQGGRSPSPRHRKHSPPPRSPSPEHKSKKKEDVPVKLLDDLFRKTKATPCIYWLPLSAEMIVIKEEQRRKHMAEHERRMAEIRRAERMRRNSGRGPRGPPRHE